MAIAWVMALPAAAFAAGQPHARVTSIGYAFALMVYDMGRVICHQRPERSFHLFGAQLAVCGRCAGIYAGAAAMALAAWVWTGPARRSDLVRPALWLALAPAAATLVYEWLTGHTPANWIRALSGVPAGALIAWIVSSAAPARRELM